jgi:hypothetical protein
LTVKVASEFTPEFVEVVEKKRFRDIEPPPWRGERWRQQRPMIRQRLSHRQIGRKKKRF